MTQRRVLIVRLTKNQHERIKVNAQSKGYKTISDYIRSLALERDISFEKKFDELYSKIITIPELKKNKENQQMRF